MGELNVGQVVFGARQHGLYVNSLLKSKVDLHWKKRKF